MFRNKSCSGTTQRYVETRGRTMRRFLFLVASAMARPLVRELGTQRDFDRLLAHHKMTTGLPVVVDFYSNSCGPCRMIAPRVKELAAQYKDKVVFAKVNVDQNREVASRLRISSMPTFHFYGTNGKKKNEFSGASEQQLKQFTDLLAADFAKNNFMLSLENLLEFYATADFDKTKGDVEKILAKCASMSSGEHCVGGAAKELVKKLDAKFGDAPKLEPRYSAEAPQPKRTPKQQQPPKKMNIGDLSTEDLLAELAKRGDDGDDVAMAMADAGEALLREEEEEEEEEEELPMYEPPRHWEKAPPERVVILGGGPAGLSAAIYAARAGLSPVVVAPPGGGQLLGKGVWVENFPGVNETGPGLVMKMQQHAAEVGAAFYTHAVTKVHLDSQPFILETSSGANMTAYTLIIATGANARWLQVDGEADFRGGGVSSCATCDGFLYRERDVAVVGGGDAAMEDALVLARTSKSVTLVHRRDKFRASHAMADRVLHHPKIQVKWNTTVEKFLGTVDDHLDDDGAVISYPVLRQLLLRDTESGDTQKLDVAGAFVAIGHDPNTWLFQDQLAIDDTGYLVHSNTSKFATELSVPGVFAAGDVADKIYRQAITSAGTGAAAALDAERFLSEAGLGIDLLCLDDILPALPDADASSSVNIYDDLPPSDILHHANTLSS